MADVVRVQIEDPGKISGSLRGMGKSGRRIARTFYKEMGRNMVNRARYFAPFRKGTLRKRIHATNPTIARGEIMMTIEAPYSIIMHEDLTLMHPGVGRAKFIELAVLEGIDKWGPLILKAIQAAADDGAAAAKSYAKAAPGGFVGLSRAVDVQSGPETGDWR